MKTELDEILEFYKNEKLTLEKLIDDLVRQREFKQAHFHQKAWKKVNRSLFLFHNLRNPNYAEIVQLQQTLENLQKLDGGNPFMKDFFESKKHPIELQLQKLVADEPTVQMDSQVFDDVIFDLVEGKIKHFQFFINTKTKLYLDFKLFEKSIIIEIPKYKKLKKNFILLKSNVAILKNIGFERNKTENTISLNYDINSFKDANPIKTLVSRVVYECFGHHHIENPSIIVIIA